MLRPCWSSSDDRNGRDIAGPAASVARRNRPRLWSVPAASFGAVLPARIRPRYRRYRVQGAPDPRAGLQAHLVSKSCRWPDELLGTACGSAGCDEEHVMTDQSRRQFQQQSRGQSRELPERPDLRRLKDEAKQRVRAGEFPTLADAQLAVAREHGFASWPRLKTFVDTRALDIGARAAALVRSACSSDLRTARTLLEAEPGLARHDLATACVTGEIDDVRRRIDADPGQSPGGARHWTGRRSPTRASPASCGQSRPGSRASSRWRGCCSPPAPIPTPAIAPRTARSRCRSTARPVSPTMRS